MSQSKISARVAALRTLGYKVSVVPGLDVVGLPRTYPHRDARGAVTQYDLTAYKVLQPCDEILGADGHTLRQPGDLSKIVKAHRPGTAVTLRINRAGHDQTVRVPV